MRRPAPVVPLLCLALASCSGNCSQNAVVVADEVRRLGSVVDTVEVFADRNGDGAFTPDERGFVIDPRPSVAKIVRVAFTAPVPRAALAVGAGASPPFVDFSSFFDPFPDPWVKSRFFDDDPSDVAADGPAVTSVTYRLHDDLVDTKVDIAVPVKLTLALQNLDPSLKPADLAFVLARQPPPDGPPPRIVAVTPSPPPPGLPGWGRPILASDFGPGDDLAAVLARVDQNFVGAAVADRVAPHTRVSFTFDDPMTNMVVAVTPSPTAPGDPRGIDLAAPTVAFLNPFTVADSDTAIGMAPDTIYQITALSSFDVVHAPIVAGTQNDQGQFLMPELEDALYATLRAGGLDDGDLAGDSRYTFRTGPFRLTSPTHHGDTNATTAAGGHFTAHLQFARPVDGMPAPATVTVTVAPRTLPATVVTVPFPAGTADRIAQDGVVRTTGVTVHALALQLPTQPFDDVVAITAAVSGAAGPLGGDSIVIHHDNIPPTLDSSIDITNTYSEGDLDRVCLISDCDTAEFTVQVSGGLPVTLRRGDAEEVSVCVDDRAHFCFAHASLGLRPGTAEGPEDVTFVAIDDQGNASAPVVVHTRPTCQIYGKFIGTGGQRAAVATGPDGTPLVAWVDADGRTLRYAEPRVDGQWLQRASTIVQLPPGHSFGTGIDMILDPADLRAVVCFVDAVPDPTDASSVGRLSLMELGAGGTWFEVTHKDNVRPLGCSLTAQGFQILAGWIEPGEVRFGLALSLEESARTFPAAPSLPADNGAIWDVSIAAHGPRVYYAYRIAHPVVGLPAAPGSVIAGYVEGPIGTSQLVCPPGATCPQFGGQILGNPDSPVTLGYGPRLVADAGGVALAYVSVADDGQISWERERAIEVLQADHPALGQEITFDARFHDATVPALGHIFTDGVSTPATVLAVPFGPVALVRGRDGRLVVGWARGHDTLGDEDVAVARVDRGGAGAITAIDRRVATVGDRTETIATHLSVGVDGYDLVYRNPTTGFLQFAAEQETLPIDPPGGTFACRGAWVTSTISRDELNLSYAVPGSLWTQECAGAPPLPRPWFLSGFEDEAVGTASSLLRDVAAGTQINDGRGLLKLQRHVCLPVSVASDGQPDFAACNPNLGGAELFVPPSVSQSSSPRTQRPTNGVAPSRRRIFHDLPSADAACPAATGQVVTEPTSGVSVNYVCVECPAGRLYDPSLAACVSCPAADFAYAGHRVDEKPRFLHAFIFGIPPDSVTCAACPATTQDDRDHGVMPFVISPDGNTCSRCTPGSQPYSCTSDDDCLVFANARCTGDTDWQGRRAHPSGSICVTQCTSDADCHGGRCDGPAHTCRTGTGGPEMPSATDFLCRPIGCDECFRDDFCATDDECPRNHKCYVGGPTVLSPVCVLRPLLSPKFEAFLATLPIPPPQLAELRARLETQRENLRTLLALIKMPNEVQVPIPVLSGRVVSYSADVNDVHIELGAGGLAVRLEMGVGTFQTDTPVFVNTDGPWSITFFYGLNAEPRDGGSTLAYSGLGVHLIDVRVDGEIELPPPIPNQSLAPMADVLKDHLGPFTDTMAAAILDALGGLQPGPDGLLDRADLVRCMFAPLPNALPQQCPDGSLPQIWTVAPDPSHVTLHYEACR